MKKFFSVVTAAMLLSFGSAGEAAQGQTALAHGHDNIDFYSSSVPDWIGGSDTKNSSGRGSAARNSNNRSNSGYSNTVPDWIGGSNTGNTDKSRSGNDGSAGSNNSSGGVPDWIGGASGGSDKTNGSGTSGTQNDANNKGGSTVVNNGMVSLTNIRYGSSDERLRIVLDLSGMTDYQVTKEKNDTRLVVTMSNISTAMKAAPYLRDSAVKDIILGSYGSDMVQLIIDMRDAFETEVSTRENPSRLVIDINKTFESSYSYQVAKGLDYTKYVRYDGRGSLTAYVLELDRSRMDLRLALAGGNIFSGRSYVRSIARSNGAIAAVNGGYFGQDGSLIGNTRLNGQTAGTTYYTRTSLGFMPDGSLKFAPSAYYGEVDVNGKKIYLSGVNCERGTNGVVLYNSLFGSYTGTNEFGKEYVVRNGKVVAINQGNTYIPADGQVISAHGTAQNSFAGVKVGDRMVIGENFGDELDAAQNIVGAGPELLRNGQINVTSTKEQFPRDIAVGRAPRTAVGVKANGNVILLVIDGRQSHSAGATLTETAEMLKMFGAVDGFNLDGGGSSEMVVQNQVMNSPSDGNERPVGSALVVVAK